MATKSWCIQATTHAKQNANDGRYVQAHPCSIDLWEYKSCLFKAYYLKDTFINEYKIWLF